MEADGGVNMDTEYGIFILEPEWDHPIYHLSEDDQRALCGRSVERMICMGIAENPGAILSKISVWHVGVWRCCAQCKKALKRRGREEDHDSSGEGQKNEERG